MDDANPARRWHLPWHRAEAAPSLDADGGAHLDDPADMGTAFGLDLSLTPVDELPSDRHRSADEAARD